jgi:hypothetical protein
MYDQKRPTDAVFPVWLVVALVGLALLSIALGLLPEPSAILDP